MACENGIEDQFFEDQFFEDSPREDDSEMNGVEEVAKEGAKANGSLNGNGHSMHADASKSNEEDAKKKMGGRKEDAGVSKDETEEDPAEKDGGGDAEMSDADEKDEDQEEEEEAEPEESGKASQGEAEKKGSGEGAGEDQTGGDEEKTSQGGSYVCRFCDKAFSHAPARIQHERACAAALGVAYTRPGSSPTDAVAAEDAAPSAAESRKRKRAEGGGDDKDAQQDEDAKLAEDLAHDAEENWPEDDNDEDDDGTKSPTTYAPFSKHDPNKPLPVWATDPDSTVITDEEKECIPEFFCGRPIKTPERYLGIRRHLQLLWDKARPNYLKKSSCLGIKGDVNAIGRVHSYLESLGIINLGAVQMPTPPSKTARSASPPAKEKPVRKETKPKSNRWTKAKEARAAKKEKELQREREKNEREERKKKEDEGEGDKEEKEDSRKTAWQTRREEASFDAGLEKERRKRKSARTEACLSKDGNQDTAGGYCGGSAVMCLMLPLPERITRFRAMEVLQVQQQETRRLQDRRSTAANRRNNVLATIVRKNDDDEENPGPCRPQDILPALDHTTLKKYRRQFRLDMPLQAPREELASVVVEHFVSHRLPAEHVTISKFIETVKGRRNGETNPVANTLENRRAMQKALAAEAAKDEDEDEDEEEEEEEVFTIVQDEKRIEFTISAKVKVLYDDDTWYPGEIVAFTETTGKFRFKLTEGSNTRFSEWLPNSDVKIVDYVLIEGEQQPNPNAIEPPSAPSKAKKEGSAGGEAEEEDDDDDGDD